MKKTIKRQIAEFVASKGSATRMEIIEFYVDLKNGAGHYESKKNTPIPIYEKNENGMWIATPHPTKQKIHFADVYLPALIKFTKNNKMNIIPKLDIKVQLKKLG